MQRPLFSLSALLLGVAGVSYLFAEEQEEADIPLLASGETRRGRLEVGADSEGRARFRVDVPTDAVALHVELRCAQAELELHAASDVQDDEEALVEHMASSGIGPLMLAVDRFSDPPLAAGTYTVEVCYPWAGPPVWKEERLAAVEYELETTLVRTREDGDLRPGELESGVLDDASGRFRTYRIDVPENASALRIDVVEASGDVDLELERERPIVHTLDADHVAAHGYGRETLVVTPASDPPLAPGAWFLDVVDPWGAQTGPARFALRISFSAEPPEELLAIPPFRAPEQDEPLARALRSVVEIFVPDGGGSGSIIGAEGIVVTCAHVVADYALRPLDEVVLGVTDDLRSPSVERFRARVVRFDAERDLAVLRVVSGFHGQPLPEGYRFPALELGDPSTLAIGDPLWLVGYPGTGGSKSRVSITATRGIVAGFDAGASGPLVKTDAKMHEGHSGGAALDAAGRLVAVPSFATYEGLSEMSYLIAVEPADAEK